MMIHACRCGLARFASVKDLHEVWGQCATFDPCNDCWARKEGQSFFLKQEAKGKSVGTWNAHQAFTELVTCWPSPKLRLVSTVITRAAREEGTKVMMRSSMNANSSYEEDDFAPNPFRSSTSSDLLDNTPRQQQQPQFHDPFQTPQMYATQPPPPSPQMYAQQPPPPQMMMQQPASTTTYPQPVPNPVHYLSGQMDTGGAARPEQYREGLTAPPAAAPAAGLFGWLLSCIRLDQASKLFDVDADDVALRLRYSLTQFFRPDYFRTTVLGDGSSGGTDTTSADGSSAPGKGPDLYGPFWVSMTLIFILGVASNLSDYLHYQRKSDPDSQFEYDITHVRIDTVYPVCPRACKSGHRFSSRH
jgi:hypothetical protein